MRAALMLLPIFALAACDPPLEEAWAPETYAFEKEGRALEVRAQYDPVEMGWFTRISEPDGRLELSDRPMVIDLVENQVGPELCDGNPLSFEPGEIWNARTGWSNNPAKGLSHYMSDNGEWQIVARCT